MTEEEEEGRWRVGRHVAPTEYAAPLLVHEHSLGSQLVKLVLNSCRSSSCCSKSHLSVLPVGSLERVGSWNSDQSCWKLHGAKHEEERIEKTCVSEQRTRSGELRGCPETREEFACKAANLH